MIDAAQRRISLLKPGSQSHTLLNKFLSLDFHSPAERTSTEYGDIELEDVTFDDHALDNTSLAESLTDQFDHELATQILSRIESRLPGRVRQLAVFTTENAVILTGECSTFYTKQLAQHAAMGVLGYEKLINNIGVRPVK